MSKFLLHELAANGDVSQLKILLRVDGVNNINFPDDDFCGNTPLHWAVSKGHKNCCSILLENGADVTLCNQEGATAGHCAAEAGNVEIIELLHKYGADLNVKDKLGVSPRHVAFVYGHRECVEYIDKLNSILEEAVSKPIKQNEESNISTRRRKSRKISKENEVQG